MKDNIKNNKIIEWIVVGLILCILSTIGFVVMNKDNNSENIDNKSKTIRIITDRSDIHLGSIINNFEKETGIIVELETIDKGLLSKIENRNNGDIYISKNSSEILAADKKDLLGKIDDDIIKDVDSLYKSDKGTWFNMSSRIRALYIKKGINSDISTYEDLSDSKYKGEICIRKLDHNYNIELVSYILQKHGEDYTKKWLIGLNDNLGRNSSGNDRAQIKGIVIDKDCTIAIANTYYMGLMLDDVEQQEWANGVDLLIPNQKEGEGGAISLYSAVGIGKDIINQKEVDTFLRYILNPVIQQELSALTYEYPIIGESKSEMVKSFAKVQGLEVGDIKHTSISQEEITNIREKALLLIKTVK